MVSSAFAQQSVLDSYVQQGLENNLGLQQKNFSLQKSMYALKEARGMFLPSVTIEARYSRADGGRLIEIPVGDLVNPIYSTLNQLLASVGQPAPFPENIPNESVPFLREKEHDTKLRIVQPIFQPAIYYNYKIKSDLTKIKQAELEIYKQHLTADIKIAHFNYLKTVQVVSLLDKTKKLLNENLRVSEKLFQNGKATEEVVFRAQAELADLNQQITEAQKNNKLASAYFNFLLNRPFDSHILVDEEAARFEQTVSLEASQSLALANRKEFMQLNNAIEIARGKGAIAKSAFLPGVSGVFDYGYQGEEYDLTKENDYWMASLVLQWNLFSGFKDRAQKKQADMEKNELEIQLTELENKIKLQVQESYDNLVVAQKSIESARKRLTSAEKSFDIVRKKYEQGMAPHIEYLNARTSMTGAAVNEIIVTYDLYIKHAEFERVIGK